MTSLTLKKNGAKLRTFFPLRQYVHGERSTTNIYWAAPKVLPNDVATEMLPGPLGPGSTSCLIPAVLLLALTFCGNVLSGSRYFSSTKCVLVWANGEKLCATRRMPMYTKYFNPGSARAPSGSRNFRVVVSSSASTRISLYGALAKTFSLAALYRMLNDAQAKSSEAL